LHEQETMWRLSGCRGLEGNVEGREGFEGADLGMGWAGMMAEWKRGSIESR
jgi:hypothetical protein